MENFVTKNQEELIKELQKIKLDKQIELKNKIGIARQFIRENIEAINKTIEIIQGGLDKLKSI